MNNTYLTRLFRPILSACALAYFPITTAFAEVKVVATLPLYGVIAKKIGGDRVSVTSLLQPQKGVMLYEPTADDVTRLRTADLLVHSGLGAEGWLPRLVEKTGSADFKANGSKQLGLAAGFPILQTREQLLLDNKRSPFPNGNPYFALSPRAGLAVSTAISDKLTKIDPQGADLYRSNLDALRAELEPKIAAWTAAAAKAKGRKLVGYRFEGVYLADFLGMSLQDAVIDEMLEMPSTMQIQDVVMFMGFYKVPAILRTESSSKEIVDDIAKASSAKVVTICENVGDLPQCSGYSELLAHNVDVVTKAVVGN